MNDSSADTVIFDCAKGQRAFGTLFQVDHKGDYSDDGDQHDANDGSVDVDDDDNHDDDDDSSRKGVSCRSFAASSPPSSATNMLHSSRPAEMSLFFYLWVQLIEKYLIFQMFCLGIPL